MTDQTKKTAEIDAAELSEKDLEQVAGGATSAINKAKTADKVLDKTSPLLAG